MKEDWQLFIITKHRDLKSFMVCLTESCKFWIYIIHQQSQIMVISYEQLTVRNVILYNMPKLTRIDYFILDPRFLSKRCAEVVVKGKVIGTMGVLHPQIIENFELIQPCSAIEINIQNFEI